jgi:hypothetical protein
MARAVGSSRIVVARVALAVVALAGGAIAAAALAAPAHAESGTQSTPGGVRTLISKDVGGERWAIALEPRSGTVTGNVFPSDGSSPKFVWCERVGDDGRLDPRAVAITLRCSVSAPCPTAPCPATAWQPVGDVTLPGDFFLPALDPFSPLQLPEAFCDPLAHRPEPVAGEPSYGVDTGGCSYLTVRQPSLVAIEPGDRIFLRVFHFALWAPEPAVAYLSVQVGENPVWSTTIAIPSDSALVRPIATADFGAPAGSPVYFHVQNHGLNSYNLIEIRVGGASAAALVSPDAWVVASEGVPALVFRRD